jgi:uncharacterized phage protein (TIGR01671 family)
MRELKFRAWCILEKKGSFVYFDLENRNSFSFDIMDEPPVFQQYTGLKDKNGNLIYEGDILSFVTTRSSYDGLFSGNTLIGEVKWSDLHCASVFKISSDDRHDGEEFQLFNDSRNKEIIGSIFETPELLK